MPRRATGEVIERRRADRRTFALRFRAYGRRQFLTLGSSDEGWTRQRAEAALRYVPADVERGVWAPELARPAKGPLRRRSTSSPPNGSSRAALSCDPPRSPTTAGSSATTCCRSSTSTGCRRSRSPRSTATAISWFARASSVPSRSIRRSPGWARSSPWPKSATSSRATPGTALRWRDIDLANGRISVGDSKTEAGIRLVDILPALRDELTSHRYAAAAASPDDLVFPTSSGSRRDKDNARERVIRPVAAAAALVARRGHAPLPDGVTAHKLRHTFASSLYVRGEDPAYVMAQLGHHRSRLHPARLRPRDAPRRRRQGAAESPSGGP